MLKKNDEITLEIVDISHEGNGVGRHEGMVVFVPKTVDGDIARVRIGKVNKHVAYGILQEILTPSPARIVPDCHVFGRCGGCSLRHMTYAHELEIKHRWVQENLRRIGGIDITLDAIVPSPQEKGYRNKAQYPVQLQNGKAVAGFFAQRSHRVVASDTCALQPEFFGDIVQAVLAFMEQHRIAAYDEEKHKGLVRNVYIRWGETTEQVMVCIVINGERLPQEQRFVKRLLTACPNIKTVLLNTNTQKTNVILGGNSRCLHGDGKIEDSISGVVFEISEKSFYQVNRQGAEALYALAEEYAGLSGNEVLMDLYCGVGTIGLSMAHKAKKLIGVEIVAAAVEDAKQNALRNGTTNAEFFCADAKEAAQKLQTEGVRPDVVLLDPPRTGCDAVVIESVCQMQPDRIVYISCNSSTLARDCRLFVEQGYRVVKGRALDMFPRTAHVEAMIMMTYCGSVKKTRG